MLVPTTEQKEDLFDLTVMFQFLIGMVSTARSSEVVVDKAATEEGFNSL